MLPQEVTVLIGRTGDALMLSVERGAIKKFSDAVDDRNLLYWDEDYARASGHHSLVAPPGFFGWPVKWGRAMPWSSELREVVEAGLAKAGYTRTLDGGIDYEFYRPVHAGDLLASLTRIAGASAHKGKTGTFALYVLETTYTNQNGDLVASVRQTTIVR